MIDESAAIQLHVSGRWDEAEAAYRSLLIATPSANSVRQNLARVLLEQGKFAEAMEELEAALELEPQSAELAILSGRVWAELGDLREAAGWFERAKRLDPNNAEATLQLGYLTLEHGDPERAETMFRAMLAANPELVGAHHGLSRALLDQGDAEGAVREEREAIRLNPNSPGLHSTLGQTLSNSGDLKAAVDCFRTALKLNPRFVPALGGLASTIRGDMPDDEIETIHRLLALPGLSAGKASHLHFGLGQVYDGRGEYYRAAEHVALGNQLQEKTYLERDQPYDPEESVRFTDALIEQFTPAYFERTRGFGSASRRPIFIVGLPRSGTTLVEQVLASHPNVFGAGERRFANLGFSALPAATQQPMSPVACLPCLTPEIATRIAGWHLDQLRKIDATRDHVADKMPENYNLLGWIATLFPNALIMHCTRDVRDVAVSCWVTNFSHIRWANDLEHLAGRVNDYRRVMKHYREVLPVPMLEVPYAEMVGDQEGTTRRMLEFAQLDWDPGCLNFHQTDRLVKTASVAQVRQPIYTKSVARWKRYEAAIAPFLAKLADDPAD